ncbi:Crp/Fnr family transcriptional regulator [Bacillus sp. FJAT-47783]|uniref:Crp/Fnr family transcriptional regulator n=1 Tax=Bacillus sp. FJAT-47783 TaxID=2922712 RepID=UPI001FADE46C|nr:Crp/Fnr family transcriptional regulator [Bacillus sp. FJAT-47783]
MNGNETHIHACSRGTNKSCVSLVPIFNHLENEHMEEIMKVVESVSYKKGEILYRAGDPSDSLYIVYKGEIKIYRLSESGKEKLVRLLVPGNFTGELALFNETLHEAYAEATKETQVCIIKRAKLQELLMKYPSISLKILNEFSVRLELSEKQAARFATEKVETRLALFLAECLNNHQSNEIVLPMSKKDLASYLGTTPETISRKLTHLENQGYIKQKAHKRIEIVDLDGLLLI